MKGVSDDALKDVSGAAVHFLFLCQPIDAGFHVPTGSVFVVMFDAFSLRGYLAVSRAGIVVDRPTPRLGVCATSHHQPPPMPVVPVPHLDLWILQPSPISSTPLSPSPIAIDTPHCAPYRPDIAHRDH